MIHEEDPLSGRTLAERYQIGALLGSGGMGAVYEAVDLRLERTIAVKVISYTTGSPPALMRLRARFRREARAAARLQHLNVVTVHDFGADDSLGLDFLVMERLYGEDLSGRLARVGTCPPAEVVELLTGALRGVAMGHRAELVHGDLKPANLFVVDGPGPLDVRVRVLDFGIAQLHSADATQTHLTVSRHSPLSPAYASPEQLRGESHLTPASDVFGLGATAFHLLTGQRVFTPVERANLTTRSEVRRRSLRNANPNLPVDLDRVITRALELDPAHRFPDADAFLVAVETLSGSVSGLVSGSVSGSSDTLFFGPSTAPKATPAADVDPPLAPTEWAADPIESPSAPVSVPKLAPAAVEPEPSALTSGPLAMRISARLPWLLTVRPLPGGARVTGVGRRRKEGSRIRRPISALPVRYAPPLLATLAVALVGFGSVRWLQGQGWGFGQSALAALAQCSRHYGEATETNSGWRAVARACGRAYASGELSTADGEIVLDRRIEALTTLGQLGAAEESARALVQLRPARASSYLALGEALYLQQNIEEALWAYRRARELPGPQAMIRFRSGQAWDALGQHEAALEEMRAALRLDPQLAQWPPYYQEVSRVLFALGRTSEGVEEYRRVTQLLPDWADGFGNLGMYYHRLRRYSDAVSAYERALEIEPNFFESREDQRRYWQESLRQVI